MAEKLETHKILIRGDCNARVLNTITRSQLARQLTEDFPLAFYKGEWAERNGSWGNFLKDGEVEEQKKRTVENRIKRKEKSLKKKSGELDRIFASQGVCA